MPELGAWRGRPIAGVRVIGICGAARHGKDQLAQYLLQCVPGAERFAFSDGLAAYARVQGAMTMRDPKILQNIGMDLRHSRPGVWLDVVYGAIEDRRPPLAIITGVRFADEAALVRSMGGRLLKVVRVDAAGRPYVSTDRPADHPAERAIASLVPDVEVQVQEGDFGRLHRFANDLVAALAIA